MLRGSVVVLAFALVMASGPAAMSEGAAPKGFDVLSRAELYSGVDYLKLAKPAVPLVAHVAHIAPGAPVDLRVVNANDKISAGVRELETTSSMCRRARCVVGVNGDFHDAGVPVGAVVADGRMLRSPDPGRAQLTVTGDGHLVAGPLPWSGALSAGGVQIGLAAVNADPPPGGLALYTPAYGARTPPSGRTELVVGAPGGVGALNRPAGVALRGLRTGAGAIPADGAVLAGDGDTGQQLSDLWARRPAGGNAAAQVVVTSPIDAAVSLGVEPVVLRDAKRALPWRDPNLIAPRQPHTLVGWNKAGDTYLVAVDGRQPRSEGATMAEAADFLLSLGATDAVSLDGGGGTTFVAGGAVWNRPSDNNPARPDEYEERGATNALVVMSRPGAPLPARSPAPPAPLPTASPTASGPGAGGRAETAPGSSASVDGFDGGPLAPPSGVGGALAPGELPLGPASTLRWASADAASGNGATGRAGDPGAPDGARPIAAGSSSHGEARPRGGPVAAMSTLTSHVVEVAVARRWTWARLAVVVMTGLAGLALVRIGTRRRQLAG